MDRMGLLALAIFVIAVVGLWHFTFQHFAARHNTNPIVQAGTRFWGVP